MAVWGVISSGAADEPASEARGTVFRVMSYNIHHGEGTDGRIDLERIAELIRRERADIVALQEVDRGVQRTSRRDLPAELAALTGLSCVFSNNFHFQGGEYGNATLSRFPVVQRANHHYEMLREGEQRGLLQAVVEVEGRPLLVMNTHLDFRPGDDERVHNVGEIVAVAGRYPALPAVVCGDFNDVPESRTHAKMKERFLDTWETAGQGSGFTIPSGEPRKRIDFIFFSKGTGIVARRAWVPRSEASDHLPVVVELKWEQ